MIPKHFLKYLAIDTGKGMVPCGKNSIDVMERVGNCPSLWRFDNGVIVIRHEDILIETESVPFSHIRYDVKK